MDNTLNLNSEKYNNRLVRSLLLRMLPANTLFMVSTEILALVDSMLAGTFISVEAVSAVGIVIPVYELIMIIFMLFCRGMRNHLAIYIGRHNTKKCNEMFSTSICIVLVLSALIILAMECGGGFLVSLLGAANQTVEGMVGDYIKIIVIALPFAGINLIFSFIFSVYGKPMVSLLINVVSIVVNLLTSTTLVFIMTSNRILALGMGTIFSNIVAAAIALVIYKKSYIPLEFGFDKFRMHDVFSFGLHGMPVDLGHAVQYFVRIIINNAIINGFGAVVLAYYTVVTEVYGIISSGFHGFELSAGPLFGMFFGCNDRQAIIKTMKETFKISVIVQVFWSLIIVILSPAICGFFGITEAESMHVVKLGIIVCALGVFVEIFHMCLMTAFEAMEHFVMAIIFSVVGESVLFPLFIGPLSNAFGYVGLFASRFFATAVLVLGYWIAISIIYKSRREMSGVKKWIPSIEELMLIEQRIINDAPIMDLSLDLESENISGISENIIESLNKVGNDDKKSYISGLCTEEIAVDMMEHYISDLNNRFWNSKVGSRMDVKIFNKNDKIRIFLRSDGKMYNPLDFDFNMEDYSKIGVSMAQKLASNIRFEYLYCMNVVVIDL